MRPVSPFSLSRMALAKSVAISPPTVRPGYLPGWAAAAEFATLVNAAVSTRLWRVVVMGPLMDSVHLHHRISREARPRVACHAACTARLAAARLGCLAVGQRSCRSCSLANLSRTLMKAL